MLKTPPGPAIALLIVMLLSACAAPTIGPAVRGSGNAKTASFELEGFDAISLANSFNATVTAGDEFEVTVTTDENLFETLEVEQEGSTLVIGFRNLDVGGVRPTVAEATIVMPKLAMLKLSGASQATVSGFAPGEAFAANVSGASQLRGQVEAERLNLEASGASTIELGGSGANLEAKGAGASSLRLGGLPVNEASVVLSGASNGTVTAIETLDYELSGASHLKYSGNPSIGRSDVTGASSAVSQ